MSASRELRRRRRCLFAADLVGAGALRIFFGATGLEDSRREAISDSRRLRQSAADSKRRRAWPLCTPRFQARCAPGPFQLRGAWIRVRGRQGSLRPGGVVAALPAWVSRCMAWRRLDSNWRSAEKTASARCGLPVDEPRPVGGRPWLRGCGLEEGALLGAFLGDAGELGAGLVELGAGAGNAGF